MKARRHLWAAWTAVQVEFQGRYSVARLQQLHAYSKTLGIGRLTAILLLTPLPSLAISLLKELPPLNPPDAGVLNNKIFFVRAWLIIAFINANVLLPMGQASPRLKLTLFRTLLFGMSASFISISFVIVICIVTVFPLPFGLLVAAFPDAVMIQLGFVYVFRPMWQIDSSLWIEVKRQLSVFYCQLALTFVYPIYIYGFVSLTGIHQVMFVIILPIIQIIARNWVSRQLTDNDLKPESVIFIVEVFNALYVSNALHNSSSWKTTAMIMVIDFAHFWLSMLDVVEVLNEVKALMAKIPRDHPVAKENFVHIALLLMETECMLQASRKSSSEATTKIWNTRLEAWVSSQGSLSKGSISWRTATPFAKTEKGNSSRPPRTTAQIFPACSTQCHQWQSEIPRVTKSIKTRPSTSLGLETIFSRKQRALFIRKSARILFITEYIVLIEYAEVALPIIYCT
ncbi:unnamed protein product [Phytophthora fragariaefolia]|uniref:Unnamed protein product n=1 Tax=Phytophthora fragariaefolia TaxID=1490495 RepID=A0A9W6XM28_9STRA|nr:unnamed protein product [Phytophthora fragariaefolia]